jgi:hypothetical protein
MASFFCAAATVTVSRTPDTVSRGRQEEYDEL